ncbi:hypothetical protein DFJ77DRAFT_465422 [Powellomyces hirtus]|nr:hypothetical protein DFJ77DRAFT_465422 [Powellomyces hirtus]
MAATRLELRTSWSRPGRFLPTRQLGIDNPSPLSSNALLYRTRTLSKRAGSQYPAKFKFLIPLAIVLIIWAVIGPLYIMKRIGPRTVNCHIRPAPTGLQQEDCAAFKRACNTKDACESLPPANTCEALDFSCRSKIARDYEECIDKANQDDSRCLMQSATDVSECYKRNSLQKQGRIEMCETRGGNSAPLVYSIAGASVVFAGLVGVLLQHRAVMRVRDMATQYTREMNVADGAQDYSLQWNVWVKRNRTAGLFLGNADIYVEVMDGHHIFGSISRPPRYPPS